MPTDAHRRLVWAWMVYFLVSLAAAQAALAQPHTATGAPVPGAERTLRVASELDFPPLALVRPDGGADGFSVDLFEAVAGVMALKYLIYTGSWNSVKDDVIAGKADLLINMAINPARATSHDFTVPHTVTRAAIFVRKDDKTVRTLDDLRGKSLLVVSGDHVHQWAAQQPWATDLVPVDTVEEAMMLLAAGKHDAVLVARIVGLLTLKTARLHNIVVAGPSLPGAEQKFAFAVKKGDAELLALLNEGLAIVRADGTYDRLYGKWFHPIEPPGIPLQVVVLYAAPVLGLLLVLTMVLVYRLRLTTVALRRERMSLESRVEARTEALRQSNERLDYLLGATPAVIWTSKIGGAFARTFVSRNVHAVFGYEPDDFLRDPEFWRSRIHPEDRERVFAGLPAIERNDWHAHEYRFRHKDGSWRWTEAAMLVMRDASGAPRELVGYWIDVTKRRQAEDALHANRARYERAVNAANDGIWEWTPSTGEDYLSPRWKQLLGYEDHELPNVQESFFDQVHPEDRPRVSEAVRAHLEERKPYAIELRLRCKSGEYRWFSSRGQAEWDERGQPLHMVGSATDITERKRAEAAVTEALRAKSDFMNSVTHELRTPLNSVIGFAEMLKDEVPGPLNTKQAAFVADIVASGQRLLELVKGILEMSRLDAAEAGLAREPVEIGETLEARVAAHRVAAEARGVTMRLDIAPDSGRPELDPKALCRMLDALLDNAIKFNREGGMIEVRARRMGGALEIAVADTGIGIAQEDLAKLFRPFVQIDTGLAREHGGIGLGLALVRRLAEAQNGTIEVESEPGKGSTFTLRFCQREES